MRTHREDICGCCGRELEFEQNNNRDLIDAIYQGNWSERHQWESRNYR